MKKIVKSLEKFFFAKKAYRFLLKDWVSIPDVKSASEVINTLRYSQQIQPYEVECPHGDNFVVIAPHQDDEIIGPGGTLLKMIAQGAKITVLYLTAGKKEQAEKLYQESEALASHINFSVERLDYAPKNISCDESAVQKVSRCISNYGRDGVFVPFILDDHEDHRLASMILHKCYQENRISSSLPVWAYQVYTSVLPNVIVDITKVAEQKKACIEFYKSQYRARDWGHYALGLNAYNSRFLHSRNDAAYAEIFLQVPMQGYAELCDIYAANINPCKNG